jgi:hypothetical protein
VVIAGAWTAPPNSGGIALGIGTATTTTSAALYTACLNAFALNVWSGVSSLISTSISTLLTSSTVAITIGALAPPYTLGGGSATAAITVAPSDTTTLTGKMNTAFITGTVWATVASDIATAIDDFIKAAVITTLPSPSGTLPQGWAGTDGDIGEFK